LVAGPESVSMSRPWSGKAETPMEFALRVGDPEVRAVTHAYEVERYGGRKLGGEEASRVRGQLETLKGPKRALPS